MPRHDSYLSSFPILSNNHFEITDALPIFGGDSKHTPDAVISNSTSHKASRRSPMSRLLALTAIAISLPSNAIAQFIKLDENITSLPTLNISNFEQISADDGLCSNTVNLTYRDESGLVWIGTDDGLNTYDGYDIRSFKPDPDDSTSINGKQVLGIGEYTPLNITLALGDAGINIFSKRSGKFREGSQQKYSTSEASAPSAYGIFMSGNEIYAAFSDCIVKRNRVTGRTKRIEYPKRLANDYARARRMKMMTMPGSDGKLVILANTSSLCILDTRYGTTSEIRLESLIIYDIATLDEHRLLLATRDGLHVYDFRTAALSHLKFLKGELIAAITRNPDGDFWISYGGDQICRWSPAKAQRTDIYKPERFINAQTRINDMREDENGILWLSTSNVGVIKLDTKKTKISTAFIDANLPLDHTTRDISITPSDILWAACGPNGLVRNDMNTMTSQTINVPHENVLSVLARKDGTVMLGTSRRLVSYDPAHHSFEHIEFTGAVADSAGGAAVRGLTEDCLGNIWASTNIGLYRYNGVKFSRAATHEKANFIFNCSYEDSDGRIWAGTTSGAMVRDLNSPSFRRIGRKWNGRNDEGVFCIVEYQGKILMGTSEGVKVFDKNTAVEVNIDLFKSFASRVVYSIVSDATGIIWLNTSAGIGYVDFYYGNVYNFGHNDGLYNEGNECHKFSVANGKIYFGQVTAINVIDTRNITFNTRMPQTFVSEILYCHDGLEKSMTMVDDTTYFAHYSPNASTRLHVASSDFTDPDRNRFMYRLDDGEWITLSGGNEILVPSLFPGTYRVRLRSSNADKTWSYDILSVYIHIESPLYLSRPALIFYAIWIMGMVWLFLNMRFQKSNRESRKSRENERAKEIAEEQRNQFAIVINEQRASFNYAKRIQDALMPTTKAIEGYFSKLFILYRPKDIVSGDFYTFYHRDGLSFVISADCTGHGVPGAFISILGIDHLNSIIMQQKVDDAGQILTMLQAELHKAFTKIGTDEVKDGMDMTICVIHHGEMRVNFAGAMNDMFIIRSNEVLEFHGERMSIGADTAAESGDNEVVFHSQDISCQPGDMMYLFSDGYCDQFGGPEHKKFKVRRFKNMLLNVHKLPAADQRMLLNQKLIEWMGGGEQTDDISVIGFQPWY